MGALELGFGIVLLVLPLVLSPWFFFRKVSSRMKIELAEVLLPTHFYLKNKGRTIDAFLSRWTTIIALGFLHL